VELETNQSFLEYKDRTSFDELKDRLNEIRLAHNLDAVKRLYRALSQNYHLWVLDQANSVIITKGVKRLICFDNVSGGSENISIVVNIDCIDREITSELANREEERKRKSKTIAKGVVNLIFVTALGYITYRIFKSV
jgi:hypothetical protein